MDNFLPLHDSFNSFKFTYNNYRMASSIPKGIYKDIIDFAPFILVRNILKVTIWLGIDMIDGRRDNVFING